MTAGIIVIAALGAWAVVASVVVAVRDGELACLRDDPSVAQLAGGGVGAQGRKSVRTSDVRHVGERRFARYLGENFWSVVRPSRCFALASHLSTTSNGRQPLVCLKM